MRKRWLEVALAAGVVCGAATAQVTDEGAGAFAPDLHYQQRMDLFAATPLSAGDIVFLGDSLTEGGEWGELFPDLPVRDRGISGDSTAGVLARLATVTAARPAAIFLLIGTNDLSSALDPAQSLAHYREILARIRHDSPATRVFVQSLLPRAADLRASVEAYNGALTDLSREMGLGYIDLYPAFLAADGSLRDEMTADELHLNGAGYLRWRSLLARYGESLRAPQGAAAQR